MHPDLLLDIQLSAICSRNQFTQNPGPVIDELRALAGARLGILGKVAREWAAHYRSDDTRVLTDALDDLADDIPA